MELLRMKLSDLRKADKNIRIHTAKQLQEYERSVRMFGQLRPIVVDENNVILAGNGLYDTLLMMKEQEADVYRYDNLTANQKKKLMIADNKVYTLGIENLDALNDFLDDLKGDLDIPGFDEEILKQMVADADEITEKISEYGTLDESEINQIKESNERREQREVAAGQPTESSHDITPPAGEDNTADPVPDTTEVRRHVVCPGCGETIWL